MEKVKKIIIILSLIVLVLPLLINICFAAEEKALETTYPTIPGATTPTTTKILLPDYVKYIFNFGIWIAGFVAFLSLIYGGVRWLTSAGNPSAVGDAKEQMFAGLLGLVILLSSWLILYNLNPTLVMLKIGTLVTSPTPDIPGVYLCEDSSKEKCVVFGADSSTIPAEMNDKATYIYFQNATGTTAFGAVVHEDDNHQGTCEVLTKEGDIHLETGKPSSITVFQQGAASGEGVTLYECKDYKIDGTKCKKWGAFQQTNGYLNWDAGEQILGEKGKSIGIKLSNKYLAVLFENKDGKGRCEVFRQSDPDLGSNHIGVCGGGSDMGCFRSILVTPIK